MKTYYQNINLYISYIKKQKKKSKRFLYTF